MHDHYLLESLRGFPLRPRIVTECLCGQWRLSYQLPWFPDEAAWYLAGTHVGESFSRHLEGS